MRRSLLGGLLLTALTALTTLVACGDGALDPLPLDVTVEASPTTPGPGQVVDFVVTAQGGNLVGVEINYGDGNAEQFATGGARTVRRIFQHAYAVAGTYVVRATVIDAVAGSKDASIDVRVQ